jgi:hypothetical protein
MRIIFIYKLFNKNIMKKITNISIGERNFSIEEDAFKILKKYLEDI